MKKNDVSTAGGRLKKNIWLVLSTLAAAVLLLSSSGLSVLLCVAALAVSVTVAVLDAAAPSEAPSRMLKIVSSLSALALADVALWFFRTNGLLADAVTGLAAGLGLPEQWLCYAVGAVCFAGSLYAFDVLSLWVLLWIGGILKDLIRVREK